MYFESDSDGDKINLPASLTELGDLLALLKKLELYFFYIFIYFYFM